MSQSTGRVSRGRASSTSRRVPPSRVRYEQSHPTVSCRVSGDIYDRLKALKESEGKTFAYVLRVGLGLLEAKARAEAEMRTAGYREGYAEAERAYKVTYACSVCGRQIAVEHEAARKAAGKYMEEHGWGHAACHERRKGLV